MTDIFLYLTLVFCLSFLPFTEQAVHRRHPQPLEAYGGHQAYYGNPSDPQPGKQVLNIDEQLHYYEPHHNNDGNGAYKRSPCPAVNTLANRGYIPRSGKRVSSQQILYAMREVWNFGDDNSQLVLYPAYNVAHPNATHLDLDQFGDIPSQHVINFNSAPTRSDIQLGNNLDLNNTLLESLLSFSKNSKTLTVNDLAEHHHLRHNDSKRDNPEFRFGNLAAIGTLGQYANLQALISRTSQDSPEGTLYISDLREFYEKEDLPVSYQRRNEPYFTSEAGRYVNQIARYIGFEIARPIPEGDGFGIWSDIEPVVAKFN